ncbi:MAG: peptidoglycan-binding protein [Calditrichia bacterium]
MPIEKAHLINLETDEALQVMFNPNQITISREVRWLESLRRHTQFPLTQFIGNLPQIMQLSLFFDTFESGANVHEVFIKKLMKFSEIQKELLRPPVLQFVWGTFVFKCVIKKLVTKYLMFLPNGTPVRAVSHVIFQEISQEESREDTQTQASESVKLHVISAGETLAEIALDHYGDSSKWRILATYNSIQDPVNLPEGVTIKIPVI